ncbi:MAG: signal peptide peptidase SppA [bacterium]|nr:signal peptide peptidase SppA [bacterium]
MDSEQFNKAHDLGDRLVKAKEKTEKHKRWHMLVKSFGTVYIIIQVAFLLHLALNNFSKSPEAKTVTAGVSSRNLDFDYLAGNPNSENKIMVIQVNGVISEDDNGRGENMVDGLTEMLNSAKEDPSVKAVVLEVQSPGGTVNASDLIYHEMVKFKKSKKPVVAYFNGIAASGGYYISMTADKIVASPETWTGSIGVIAQVPNFSGLLDKVGVKFTTIKSGAHKDMLSPFKPVDEEDNKVMQELVDSSYDGFVEKVVKGRKLDDATVRKLADGRIYNIKQAVDNKLVDKVGYLKEEAFEEAMKLAKVKDAKLVRCKKRRNVLQDIFAKLNRNPLSSLESSFALTKKPGLYFMPEEYLGK